MGTVNLEALSLQRVDVALIVGWCVPRAMDQSYGREWGGHFVVDQYSIDPAMMVALTDCEEVAFETTLNLTAR